MFSRSGSVCTLEEARLSCFGSHFARAMVSNDVALSTDSFLGIVVLAYNFTIAAVYLGTAVAANKFLLDRNAMLRKQEEEQQRLLAPINKRSSRDTRDPRDPRTPTGSFASPPSRASFGSQTGSSSPDRPDFTRESMVDVGRLFNDSVSQFYLLIIAFCLLTSVITTWGGLDLTQWNRALASDDQCLSRAAQLVVSGAPLIPYYGIIVSLIMTLLKLSDLANHRTVTYSRIRIAAVLVPPVCGLFCMVVLGALNDNGSIYIDCTMSGILGLELFAAGHIAVTSIKSYAAAQQLWRCRVVSIVSGVFVILRGVFIYHPVQHLLLPRAFIVQLPIADTIVLAPVIASMVILRVKPKAEGSRSSRV